MKRARWLGFASAVLAAAVLASCGGSDPTYRAGPFSECLDARGANPTSIARASAAADVSSVVSELARRAERDNGAVQAFGAADETYPGASEASFLFFADHDGAETARKRVDAAIDRLEAKLSEASPYVADARSNVLIVSTKRTGAQDKVIDECLGRSEE